LPAPTWLNQGNAGSPAVQPPSSEEPSVIKHAAGAAIISHMKGLVLFWHPA
jgi:hypothetical protein